VFAILPRCCCSKVVFDIGGLLWWWVKLPCMFRTSLLCLPTCTYTTCATCIFGTKASRPRLDLTQASKNRRRNGDFTAIDGIVASH
jgi:hypothetical protein